MDPRIDQSFNDSWYFATRNGDLELPPLRGQVKADVCVVGGGLTGCSAALELAGRGYRVVLLEQERIGWGASGRSGGQLLHGYSAEGSRVEKLVGAEDARKLWELSLEALDLARGRISEHKIDCDFVEGYVLAALNASHRRQLLAYREHLDHYGYNDCSLHEGAELEKLLRSPRYCAGLFDFRCGHVHPLNFTLGLARAALKAGATLHGQSQALNLDTSGKGVKVKTPQGRVDAEFVLLCGNAWLDQAAPKLAPGIASYALLAGTFIGATRPLGRERAEALIPSRAAVCDMNFILNYYRLSRDDRLLFGGRVSYTGRQPRDIHRLLHNGMKRVFPSLAGESFDHVWGGWVSISHYRLLHLGHQSPQVLFAQGFSGHGMAMSGFVGKVMAECIAGTAERFDLYARLPRRRFPGGRALRTPLLALAMFYYRLRDLYGGNS